MKDMFKMLLNGAGADSQNRGDLAIGLAGGDKSQNLTLAIGDGQLREVGRRNLAALGLHQQVTSGCIVRIANKMHGEPGAKMR